MIPYLLSVIGGYLIGSSMKETPKFDEGGGVMANGGKLMGKYAFADRDYGLKSAIKLQNIKDYEHNNKLENNYVQELTKWTINPDRNVANWFFKKRNEIKTLKSQYSKVFKPNTEKSDLVYRGMSLSSYSIERLIKGTTAKDFVKVKSLTKGAKYYLCLKPINYMPEKNAESWTHEFKVSTSFGGDVILITKLDDNFFMNFKVINEIYGHSEDETIHIGKKFNNNVYLMIEESSFEDYILVNFPKLLNEFDFKNLSKLKYANGGVMANKKDE